MRAVRTHGSQLRAVDAHLEGYQSGRSRCLCRRFSLTHVHRWTQCWHGSWSVLTCQTEKISFRALVLGTKKIGVTPEHNKLTTASANTHRQQRCYRTKNKISRRITRTLLWMHDSLQYLCVPTSDQMTLGLECPWRLTCRQRALKRSIHSNKQIHLETAFKDKKRLSSKNNETKDCSIVS